MDFRQLRADCLRRFRGLPIPEPFDIDEFCEAVSAERRRPMIRMPLPDVERWDIPCGLWVATPSIDLVFYEAGTPRSHQEHIVVHEIAHMLCGHTRPIDAELAQRLLPNTNPTLIRRLMGRAGYEEAEEKEAEILATIIMERARFAPTAGVPSARKGLTRLGATLGGTQR